MKNFERLLTGPQEDLRNFTNRDEQTKMVRSWLEAPIGTSLPIRLFYGIGGAGKSMFVAKLAERLAPEPLPLAFIDFDTGSGTNRFINDIPATLFEICRQLGNVCPRFELSYGWMQGLLNQTARLRPGTKSESLTEDLVEETASELLGKLLEVAEGAPAGAGAIVKLLRVGWNYVKAPERQKIYRQYRKTPEGKMLLGWLKTARADMVAAKLKSFLALDLVESLPKLPGHACRALIVFDTIEHLRRSGLTGRQQFTDHEKWIFDLWKELREEPTSGEPTPFVQIVLFGRDQLKDWEEYCSEIKALGALQQHLLGGFSESDAKSFLVKHVIPEAELQQAILNSSLEGSAAPKSYHVLSLGLLADTVGAERLAGRVPDPGTLKLSAGSLDQLASRFFQSLPSPTDERRIVRLARTPRFDAEALKEICGSDKNAIIEECNRILRYTFIQNAALPKWFAVHPQVRTAILSLPKYSDPDQTKQEHRDWKDSWARRSKSPIDDFASLAWYHDYQLDAKTALTVWSTLAQTAYRELRMQDHYRLLDWWVLVGLEKADKPDPFEVSALNALAEEARRTCMGLLSQNLRRAAACLQLALGATSREQSAAKWAEMQEALGVVRNEQAVRADATDGIRLLDEAVAAFRAVLEVFTREQFGRDWARTHVNLGNALREQGIRTDAPKAGLLLAEAEVAYGDALTIFTRTEFGQEWARTKSYLGDTLREQAIRTDGTKWTALLSRAVECYRTALEVLTRAEMPQDWARTQANLGNALGDQGARTDGEEGAQLLSQAVAAYLQALEVRTRTELPQDWAKTKNNLGAVLFDQGVRAEGAEATRLLGEAVQAYRDALEVRTRIESPQDWATTRSNLGVALREQGIRTQSENEIGLLREAEAAYRDVMEVFTRRELAQDWARTQLNLGNVLGDLGARTDDPQGAQLLGDAIAAYRGALGVFTRDAFAHDWATTQNNLAAALYDQGIRMSGARGVWLLGESVATYTAALDVFTREALPREWARTQNNLGGALSEQGLRTDGTDAVRLLGQAVAAYRAALEIRTRKELPQQWATTQCNLGDALFEKGIRSGSEEGAWLLGEAVAAYKAALEVRTQRDWPEHWLITQIRLGEALRKQGIRAGGADGARLLDEAVTTCQAVLEVLTREKMPQQWATAQRSLADALREKGMRCDGETKQALLSKAVALYRSALEILTPEASPEQWADAQNGLGLASQQVLNGGGGDGKS